MRSGGLRYRLGGKQRNDLQSIPILEGEQLGPFDLENPLDLTELRISENESENREVMVSGDEHLDSHEGDEK